MGMYFHCEPASSLPWVVRAPQTTVPNALKVRMQLTATGLRTPFCLSLSGTATPETPTRAVSVPAGAFQTPRLASVEA